MLDKAGWHTSPKLDVPENLTLLPLPAKCPELNPVENVWEFMRDNWLSKPHLPQLRQHRRPLLRRLEQALKSTMACHVHRSTRLGAQVLINGNWYKALICLQPWPPILRKLGAQLARNSNSIMHDINALEPVRELDESLESLVI